MKDFVVTILGTLVLVCAVAQWIASRTKSQLIASLNPEFQKFQRIFFAPYLLALFSDWLQGPYVYRLYSQYGYAPKEIALLWVFVSSILLTNWSENLLFHYYFT